MDKKKSNLKIKDIAEDIKRVAGELEVLPTQLKVAQYRKNGGKVSEWEFRLNGGYSGIVEAYFGHLDPKADANVVAIKNARKETRNWRDAIGNVDWFFEQIKAHLSAMPTLVGPIYRPSAKTHISRTLNLALSDLHLGSDILKNETGHSHGRVEEARALAAVVKNVCDYKIEYRNETELNVWILGDVIENELHGKTSADLLHFQTCRAMWLISQAIRHYAANFIKVKVFCTVGNHGRDVAIHQEKANALKINALETTIYYGIKLACANLKNVEFIQPMTPWVAGEAQGHKIFATHGDSIIQAGDVGKNITIEKIEAKANKINASLRDTKEYKVFLMGHVHQAAITQLSNGSTIIINGALVPPGHFAQSLGILEAKQVQVMWETTPEFAVGDLRFINVSDQLNDKSLDKIIVPFKDFILK